MGKRKFKNILSIIDAQLLEIIRIEIMTGMTGKLYNDYITYRKRRTIPWTQSG